MEKLAILFTCGFHTQVVFTYQEKDLYSDLGAIFEEILNEKIIPNNLWGLVTTLVDEEYTDDYDSYLYIDKGYYFDTTQVHVMMLTDEKISEYRENGIQVVDMEA